LRIDPDQRLAHAMPYVNNVGDNMPFKTILASLTGFSSDKAVLDTAVTVARPGASHIDCLHLKSDLSQVTEFIAATDRISDLIFDLTKKIAAQECDRLDHSRQAFEDACRRHAIPVAERADQVTAISARWQEMISPEDEALEQSRYHDITVVGRDRELSNEGIQNLLMRSGRPVLIAPANPRTVLDRTVAIAWKATAEAAHAISASLPLLRRAANVVIFAVSKSEADEAGRSTAEKLAAYLAWHGIKARVTAQDPSGLSEAEVLRELCHAEDADLLVMGAYGHSRARELILGGMTRKILTECAIPVLMQH
jgi:nucleotide-binding universal stress UspA family protein